jgi:hypothetical protein
MTNWEKVSCVAAFGTSTVISIITFHQKFSILLHMLSIEGSLTVSRARPLDANLESRETEKLEKIST